MKRHSLLIGFMTLGLIGMTLWLSFPPKSGGEAQTPEASEGQIVFQAQAEAKRPDHAAQAPVSKPEARVEELAPSVGQIREEVAKDPHETPESLLVFSNQLAPKMERAMASEPAARAMMPELRDCARESGPGLPAAVQVTCLMNAGRLAEAYPNLRGDFESATKGASQRVRFMALALAKR